MIEYGFLIVDQANRGHKKFPFPSSGDAAASPDSNKAGGAWATHHNW